MGPPTPLLDTLFAHLPAVVALPDLPAPSRSTVEALLAFALGADCPTRLADASQAWSRTQPAAIRALRDCLAAKGAKRGRDSQDVDDATDPKRQKTEDDTDDPPLFTLPAISATSPIRKKVDVTVHVRSIRFTNPATRALESSIPLASISRTFLLPTRGKARGHWTVVLLPTDAPDKAKTSSPSAQQVIFGLDALSATKFETTSYASGTSIPDSTTTTTTTTTVTKGEETATSVRKFLSYIPVPLLEPSASVFRSACATAKSGEGAAGVGAYLSAKPGTLWFFDTGILWGESKPCEYWAVSDLLTKDGVRLISATGRTCSVVLSRKGSDGHPGTKDDGDAEVVETEFSMVEGREQDPIHGWARNRKHLFGRSPVAPASSSQMANNNKAARPSHFPNGTVGGPAWDDSDPDDDDFEVASSEDLEHSTTDSDESEGGAGSGDENGSRSEDMQESGSEPSDEEEEEEEEEEELQEAHHPLLRPGAMPRMSKAAIDMVVDMVHGDLVDDASDEEDELEE